MAIEPTSAEAKTEAKIEAKVETKYTMRRHRAPILSFAI
jgi:hypothetical protein